jgi:hypothetical protein
VLDPQAAHQARLLHHTITAAGISVHGLWLHYFSLGGNVGPVEVDAYLHQGLDLPLLDRRILDHAAFDLSTE